MSTRSLQAGVLGEASLRRLDSSGAWKELTEFFMPGNLQYIRIWSFPTSGCAEGSTVYCASMIQFIFYFPSCNNFTLMVMDGT